MSPPKTNTPMALTDSAQRLRATYDFQPLDHLCRREFYIWDEALGRWQNEGMPSLRRPTQVGTTQQPGEYPAEALTELFGYDKPGDHPIGMLGWTNPPSFLQSRRS